MQITPQIQTNIQYDSNKLPSKTYKINANVTNTYYDEDTHQLITQEVDRIIGTVDNIEAVKQAIYHILSTERYTYIIYSRNYGVELEQYIGKDLDFLSATIEATLKEALTYDLRIKDVKVNSIDEIESGVVLVNFTAFTIYGNLVLGVNINV